MLVHNQLQYGSRFIKQCELFTSEILRQSNTFIHINAAFFRIYSCRHIWAAKRKIKLFPTLQNPEKVQNTFASLTNGVRLGRKMAGEFSFYCACIKP